MSEKRDLTPGDFEYICMILGTTNDSHVYGSKPVLQNEEAVRIANNLIEIETKKIEGQGNTDLSNNTRFVFERLKTDSTFAQGTWERHAREAKGKLAETLTLEFINELRGRQPDLLVSIIQGRILAHVTIIASELQIRGIFPN